MKQEELIAQSDLQKAFERLHKQLWHNMETKFVAPKIWEIDGELYEVSLSPGEVIAHTVSGVVVRNNRRKLIFTLIESLIKEKK